MPQQKFQEIVKGCHSLFCKKMEFSTPVIMISYFSIIGNREGAYNYESVNKSLNFRRMHLENRRIPVISIENMKNFRQ